MSAPAAELSTACRCKGLYTCGPCYSAEQAIDTEQARRDDPGDPFDARDFDLDFHFPRDLAPSGW